MKRSVVGVAVLGLMMALTLSGCGSSSPEAQTGTLDPANDSVLLAGDTEHYLGIIHRDLPWITESDETLVQAGKTVCTALKQGKDPVHIMKVLDGMTKGSGMRMTSLSMVTFCPSQIDRLGKS